MKIYQNPSAIGADLKVQLLESTIVSKELSDAVVTFSNSKFDEDDENLVWVIDNSQISDAVRVYFVSSFDTEFDISVVKGDSKYDMRWNNSDKKQVLLDAISIAKERFEKMLQES